MYKRFCSIVTTIAILLFACSATFAQEDINLLPKFGAVEKNKEQKAADQKFILGMDKYFKGDRKKAAEEASSRGWQFLRQGKLDEAMRRFNQAWLLDSGKGDALWGMATIQAQKGEMEEALKLFGEADRFIPNDIDFSADYAKAFWYVAVQSQDATLLTDASLRFSQIYKKSPQHVLNLQNWAISLFYAGDYAEAWEKIKLAEAAPRRDEIDPKFVEDLSSKMPRP